ncbi:insulin-like growth factor-binding protein 6 [Hemicordylus capensis]|uniref:insulin-like growth factor-binding protein 6 n=1 Tax=Hemicordylus capensis TaxID=884348 RepID=UPI0023030C29|nr:insulin-like growth factor-binding protein 6 [Hemicordylus capensis]
MYLYCWLGMVSLFLQALTTRSAPLGTEGGDPGAGCSSPAGCDSPENKATCDDKGCGGGGGGASRAQGEACGVYTPGCAQGLRCVPRHGERAPLHALLRGKGVCLAGAGKKRGSRRNQTEAEAAAGDGWQAVREASHPTPEPLPLKNQDPLQEAPCRMHLAAILQELRAPLYLHGGDIFIPNCDTRGFYRRKQCRASKGTKRGQCWCVDKRGHRLEGLEENPLCLLANGN